MTVAKRMAYRALHRQRQGKLYLWRTAQALYRGFRDARYSPFGACVQTFLEMLTWPR